MIDELYYENDSSKKLKHHLKLLDFFENKSQYRQFSCKQCVYHFRLINDRKRFVNFLRSKDAHVNIQIHMRSFIFNVK